MNLSRAAEEGLLIAVKAERKRRWAEDNAEFIRDYNEWIAENGIPNSDIRITAL